MTKHSLFSHEINNPLSSIKMASQLINKSKTYDKKLKISEILSVSFDMISINSKIDLLEGKNENIHEILRYSIFRLKKLDQNIKIIEKFDPSLPTIKVDKNAMIQVFDNLLLNS